MFRCSPFCLLAVCCLLNLSLLKAQPVQHATVTANIADNPSLGIISCGGPLENAAMLEAALKSCGWFRVLSGDQAQNCSLQLEAFSAMAGQNCTFEARVMVKGQSSFTLSSTASSAKLASLQLADALLQRLFQVPSLCTRRIAYVMTGRNGLKEIFSCWLDGSEQERMTYNNAYSTEPDWGHSGAMVYTLAKRNMLSVILLDTANHRHRAVSQGRGLNASAALSANGRLLALPVSGGQQVDLVLKDLGTGKVTKLTNDKHVESSPCWSPDGNRLCFVSDKLGRPQLFLISVKGGAAERLSSGGNECVSPDWSPASNRLCFCQRSNLGQYVIAVLDMSNPKQPPEIVTNAAGDWEAPSWAPDGRHLVCTRATGKSRDLYIIDTWLKTFRPLSKGANLSLPAWQP